jgi:2-polyprenyl-6-methoxyphenol hydroxylase-like FAD-dependent oxidoreductase
MEQSQHSTTEVLIVGAGPTGLMMGCQLAVHKVSFRLIDKKDSPSDNSGALIVQARSLEIFESMGIAGEALKKGIIADKVNIEFNGKRITTTSINDIGEGLSQFPFLLMLEQSKTEKLLITFLHERGHSVERGIQFKSFTQNAEGTTSILILPDGSEQSVTAKYLVAADGGNSTIRGLLKIPFTGKTYPKPIFIMDCKAKTDFVPGEINFVFSDSTVAGFFPLHDSRWRIDGSLPKEMESLQTIEFKDVGKNLHVWCKMNFTPEDNDWFSVSHSHQKYAGLLRAGNCFLAGDAAHVNTPVGAQGMNTGLQDAFNLAWKLAYVIKHQAKPELLNTYPAERSGISKGFARYADVVFKIVTSTNSVVKFFRLHIMKLFFSTIFPLLEKRKSFRQRFFKSISQINIHYHNSILSLTESEEYFLHGAPRTGDRLPYVEFSCHGENTSTYKILNPVSFNLLVLSNAIPAEIRTTAEQYNLAVTLIPQASETKILYEKLWVTKSGFYLIRPDMHIALQSANMDTHHLKKYLKQFMIENQDIELPPASVKSQHVIGDLVS